MDNLGFIYVTAASYQGIRVHYATIKYSPSGNQLWSIRTYSQNGESPKQNAVDSLGNVYVAGSDGDYLTIKYNQLTGISPISNEIPVKYNLYQNYPNPFNPTTTIIYDLPKDGTVKIIVYNLLGREVMKLVINEFKTAGRYSVVFDGSKLSSVIYFYKIKAASYTDIKSMVLIK